MITRPTLRLRTWPAPVSLALALALLIALTLPTSASADPADDAAEAAAAGWLVGQYDAGSISSPGSLGDLIFALVGAQAAPDTLASAASDLEAAAADYLRGSDVAAGPLAKALLAIRATDGDGTDVDGEDLEATLRGLMQAGGGDAGRFGDATIFVQSLALMALSTTDAGAPPAAVTWLTDRRCPEAGWSFSLPNAEGTETSAACAASGDSDVDTTALAVQAILGSSDSTVDRDGAVGWLADQQAVDGGFGENANSTGLAAQTLRAAGRTAAADLAADFVVALQVTDGADAGAIRFRGDDDGSLLLATTQGILALGAPALPRLAGSSSACTPGAEGVTVVVDLTGFDGGGIQQGCAPDDPASGLDALRGAGFAVVTSTSDFGEFVCSVEGLPELACDQPFEGRYWAYFSGQVDGSWAAYEVGADTSDPAPGAVEGWAYSDGSPPTTAVPGAVVRRLAGQTRLATAIEISQDRFADGAAGGVVLSRADGFADALAGTPLAAALRGPLLTTPPDTLPDEVATEIQRVLPPGGTVHALGGTAAISQGVVGALESLGYAVQRVAGPDRISTAVAVAEAITAASVAPPQVLITTGSDFADALAAGTAAAATPGSVVLLTGDGTAHPAVDAYLADHADAAVFAVGGPATLAYPEATAVQGPTREATAVAVATQFFTDPAVIGIARRDDFADALAGGAHIAGSGGPLVITPTGTLDPAVLDYICSTDTITEAVVYGGQSAVSGEVSLAVAGAVNGSRCT